MSLTTLHWTLDRQGSLKVRQESWRPPAILVPPCLPMRRREAAIGLAVASTVGAAISSLL